MSNPTQTFADALQQLESTRDVDAFVSSVFAADPQLIRPETGQQEQGTSGAQRFWQQYLDQFQDISSTFDRVADGEVGVLEWSSSGHLSNGSDISYRGVSLLDVDADGRVTRFATYYDTQPFTPS
ncbi:nuclear transport factor 2 family protein [uncultured Jatrophihabitans sp.]|uniref:nuclear transport factor 2 family protein n=1 Tax=uncultured Jatrophihabitans sp. TaxID=1610747 RepID=UPI0035CA6E67